jgi:hypothetical protein
MVDAYLVSNLQEGLGLSDEQFVKVLPLVKKLNGDRRQARIRRIEAVRRIQRDFESGAATEKSVAEGLLAIRQADAEMRSTEDRHLASIDAALTPVQQAKFRVMEYEVERRMRTLLERATKERTRDEEQKPRRR